MLLITENILSLNQKRLLKLDKILIKINFLVKENQFIYPNTIVTEICITTKLLGTLIGAHNNIAGSVKDILILKDNDISVEINNDVESGKLKCKDGWVIFTRLGATPQFSHIYNDKLELLDSWSIKNLNTWTQGEKTFIKKKSLKFRSC